MGKRLGYTPYQMTYLNGNKAHENMHNIAIY